MNMISDLDNLHVWEDELLHGLGVLKLVPGEALHPGHYGLLGQFLLIKL